MAFQTQNKPRATLGRDQRPDVDQLSGGLSDLLGLEARVGRLSWGTCVPMTQ